MFCFSHLSAKKYQYRKKLREQAYDAFIHELPTQLTTEDWGFAVKKGNKKVLNALNSALVSLQKDGTVAKIHKKWFNN